MLNNLPYFLSSFLIVFGIFMSIATRYYFTKLVGVIIMQSGVLLFFMSISKITGAKPPVYDQNILIYSNPLPQVLMLTAIVVGLATTSIGLSLLSKMTKDHGTIKEDELT
ncbi:MAG: cation:proton antiporter subunit C [Rickettsiaceae bacterium]|nr:cation:proton antiporter subunit C [Rickettsiaceae bacterium]